MLGAWPMMAVNSPHLSNARMGFRSGSGALVRHGQLRRRFCYSCNAIFSMYPCMQKTSAQHVKHVLDALQTAMESISSHSSQQGLTACL